MPRWFCDVVTADDVSKFTQNFNDDYVVSTYDRMKHLYYFILGSDPAGRILDKNALDFIDELSPSGCDFFLKVANAAERHDITILLLERMHTLDPPREDRFAL